MPNRIAEWAFICEKASFDSGGRLDVTGLVRSLLVEKLPFGIKEFSIVIALGPPPNTAPDQVSISLAITSPDGKAFSPTSQKSVQIRAMNDYLFVTLREMPFPMEGTYRFVVSVNGERLAEVQLPVSLAPSGPVH